MLIANIKLKYLQHWVDHLGRNRFRIRRKGHARIELPVNGDPQSQEFLAAYYAAMRGQPIGAAVAAVEKLGGSGSVHDAIARYFASTEFRDLYSPSTQNLRRPILNRLDAAVGSLPFAKMDEDYIRRWINGAAPTHGAKKTLLLGLKPFLAWSVTEKLIAVDPSKNIEIKVIETDGHHSWEDGEIAQYRAHYPLGTMERVAIELALNVCGRRSDIIKLGRQHFKTIDGKLWLHFTQEKNKKRKPITVTIPVLPNLKAAIDACPSPATALTFLTSERGLPFSGGRFGDWFSKACDAAGLPDRCVAHGLRKAAARILAENGCTDLEIMAVGGWTTLKEVQRYTKGVRKAMMSATAMAKVADAMAAA